MFPASTALVRYCPLVPEFFCYRMAESQEVLLLSSRLSSLPRGHTMTDIRPPEDKIAAAILTLASALRDQNLLTDGSVENIFGFYLRYLEAVHTGKVPPK